jgi:hypothetical protein
MWLRWIEGYVLSCGNTIENGSSKVTLKTDCQETLPTWASPAVCANRESGCANRVYFVGA